MNFDRQNYETRTTSRTTSSTASSSRSSSSTSSVYTEPGVSQDYMAIKEGYCAAIGPLTAPVAWYLEGLIGDGMSPDVILNAIQETGWARRPSPQYLRAILERYKAHGIYTIPQLLHDQEEFAENKQWYED